MIEVSRHNQAYIEIMSNDRGILQEISDFFTFEVPGHKFMPSFRSGFWDGKIRLFNPKTNLLYGGLYEQVAQFAADRDLPISFDQSFADVEFSVDEAKQFADSLNLPHQLRDYQLDAFVCAVRSGRKLLVSPTASGKSLIIYLLFRYYNSKTLLVVPTINLVHQMVSDFKSYGYTEEPHIVYSGKEKVSDQLLTISTWQSIYKLPNGFFAPFEVAIVDEAHLAKADSITKIMVKLTECPYRFGLTGTLDGTQTNELVITGLFGPVKIVTTSSELMDQGHIAKLKIRCIVLQYPDQLKKQFAASKPDYPQEISTIISNPARNRFIRNLAVSLEGSTLVLFQYVEKHGMILHELIKQKTDRPVHYVDGKVAGQDREAIRLIVNEQPNAIIVASVKTFSTGVNVPTLNNVIFAAPSKSRVRTLQSIGRALRLSQSKSHAVLFDIADNFGWNKYSNHTIRHFLERIKIYSSEKFTYKIHNVKLNGE